MSLKKSRRQLLLVLGLLLLAFALRVYRLDYQSIWWDEGISLHLATSSLSEIVRDRLNNIHPPLYFILLKIWLSLVGVSPFTGRYLSALAALGQVALVVAAVGYWAGQVFPRSSKTRPRSRQYLPWLAGGLIALSPLSVIYGQEIRVYALLPLAYLAMLLVASVLLSGGPHKRKPLILLALIEWIGLHLHYIVLFGVGTIGLWGVIVFLSRRDRPALRTWITTHLLVAILSLPWLIAVLSNWTAVQAEANAGTFATEPVPLAFLFAQVWVFHLTGLAGALAEPLVRFFSAFAAAITFLLLVVRVTIASPASDRSEGTQPGIGHRKITFRLLAQWALPLLSGLIVWSVRSFSHPRYIIAFAIALIPLLAFLTLPAKSWLTRLLAPALVISVLALSVWGLTEYYFNPQRAKPDMRSVAHYLEAKAGTGDLILIPDTDWSLPFEYDGATRVVMPSLDQSPHDPGAVLLRTLNCPADTGPSDCQPPERVFLVDYPRGTRDWQNRLPFELERRGYWMEQETFGGVLVKEYRLEHPVSALPACGSNEKPEWRPIQSRYGTLQLVSAWVEKEVAVDNAVAIALCWRSSELIEDDWVVSLALRDPLTGERLGQVDNSLVDSLGAPTSFWSSGQEIITYHVLPLVDGIPPIEASLTASVYVPEDSAQRLIPSVDAGGVSRNQELPLVAVALTAPLGLDPSPYAGNSAGNQVGEPEEMAPGLLFLGTFGLPAGARPGQTVRVPLAWRAGTGDLPNIQPVLMLEQEGRTLDQVAGAPVQGRVPTNRWLSGQTVQEFRDLRVPGGADGVAKIVLQVGQRRLELGEIAIEGDEVLFERPAVVNPIDIEFDGGIKLIGFDVPEIPVSSNAPFPLTLYWESLSDDIPTGYQVFVHLVAEDGRLIAQHDGSPVDGQRPTYDWLSGEFIMDTHLVEWREPDFAGPARVKVGLYDPLTGERVPTTMGEDGYTLPISVMVKAGE